MLHTGTRPSILRTSFPPIQLHDRIVSAQNMSFMCALNSFVHFKCTVMLFAYLTDLNEHVHFRVVDNLAILPLTGSLSIDRLVRWIILYEITHSPHLISPSHIFLKCRPPLDYLAVLQSYSDAETNNDDWRDNYKGTPLFKGVKKIAVNRKNEASVSIKTNTYELKYMASYPSSKRGQLILAVSEIGNVLTHILVPIGTPTISINPTKVPRKILLGVGDDVAQLVYHM